MVFGLSLGDLWRIRALFFCCAILIGLALALALATRLRLNETRSMRALGEQQLLAAQQHLIRIDAEQAEYQARLQRYKEFAHRHVANRAPRLEWLERLRAAAGHRHVSVLEYELVAAAKVDLGATRNPELRAGRMNLRLALLHEEDLLGLLADLGAEAGALLSVRSCSIERIRDDSEENAALRAECSIDWFSLHEAT